MRSFSGSFLWSCASLKQRFALPDHEGKFSPGVQTHSAVASAQGGKDLLWASTYCLGWDVSGAGLPCAQEPPVKA